MSDTTTAARVIPHPTLLRSFKLAPEVKRYLRMAQYPPPGDGSDDRRLTDEEFEVFIAVCERRQMDPSKRHIYATKRWNTEQGKKVLSVEATIDGLRLTADRTGRYRGQTKTKWAGKDLRWVEAWMETEPPAAAMVGVWREGDLEPITAVAHFDEFAQRFSDGNLMAVWGEKPRLMLAKCAEALALRKAFPEELGGLYTAEELDREDTRTPVARPVAAASAAVSDRPAAAAVVAGIAPLAEACSAAGFTIVAAHALAHLASDGKQVESLTAEQSSRAAGWARALADANVDERTMTGALEWLVTNASDWSAAQAQFERWIERKRADAATAQDPTRPALPAAPEPAGPSAAPTTEHVPLQVVVS